MEEINRLFVEKQLRLAREKSHNLRFLLQAIEFKYKNNNLPIPSQIAHQQREIDQRYQEIVEIIPYEEKI